jgi:hypothetical protein
MGSPDQPKRHHHVPAFHLQQWCGDDGRLLVTRPSREGFSQARLSPREVGFEKHLWARSTPVNGDRQAVERELFGPIDNAAAAITNKLIAGERDLHDTEVRAWAEFLASLHLRVPERVHRLRQEAPGQLRAMLAAPNPDFDRRKGAHRARNAAEFADLEAPHLIADAGVNLIPPLIREGKAVEDMMRMWWGVRHLAAAPQTLLTSDMPLILTAPLRRDTCIVVLPLGPRHLFLAAWREDVADRLRDGPEADLVMRTNHAMAGGARRFVAGDCDVGYVRELWGRNPVVVRSGAT